jgi:hypothetical protein
MGAFYTGLNTEGYDIAKMKYDEAVNIIKNEYHSSSLIPITSPFLPLFPRGHSNILYLLKLNIKNVIIFKKVVLTGYT